MKKIFFLTFFTPVLLFSQSIKPKKNILKYTITSLAYKGYGMEYERVLNNKFSFGFTAAYRKEAALDLPSYGQQALRWYAESKYKTSLGSVDFTKMSIGNYTFRPQITYYFSHNAPDGMYVSAFVKGTNYDLILPTQFTITLRNQELNLSYPAAFNVKTFSGGLKLGYQRHLSRTFYFDIFLTEGYDAVVKINSNTQQDLSILTSSEQLLVRQKVYDTYQFSPSQFDVIVSNTGIKINQNSNLSALSLPFVGVNLGLAF